MYIGYYRGPASRHRKLVSSMNHARSRDNGWRSLIGVRTIGAGRSGGTPGGRVIVCRADPTRLIVWRGTGWMAHGPPALIGRSSFSCARSCAAAGTMPQSSFFIRRIDEQPSAAGDTPRIRRGRAADRHTESLRCRALTSAVAHMRAERLGAADRAHHLPPRRRRTRERPREPHQPHAASAVPPCRDQPDGRHAVPRPDHAPRHSRLLPEKAAGQQHRHAGEAVAAAAQAWSRHRPYPQPRVARVHGARRSLAGNGARYMANMAAMSTIWTAATSGTGGYAGCSGPSWTAMRPCRAISLAISKRAWASLAAHSADRTTG